MAGTLLVDKFADSSGQYEAQNALHALCHNPCTGCGRKKSHIWEADKFETKEDTANIY
jgi:hypothetical protein